MNTSPNLILSASFSPPSTAIPSSVVIPEDAAGPVSIVMESSTDLVNRVTANPGNYGASTPRGFFVSGAFRTEKLLLVATA